MKFYRDDYRIEPANVHVLRCVQSINVANMPRLTVPPPETDGNINKSGRYGTPVAFVKNYAMRTAEGIVGDVNIEAGFNCSVLLRKNKMQISARPGAGASIYEMPVPEVAVTEEERRQLAEDEYLSRGMKCYELVESVNGLKGPDISMTAGAGVEMTARPGSIVLSLVEPSSDGGASCDVKGC